MAPLSTPNGLAESLQALRHPRERVTNHTPYGVVPASGINPSFPLFTYFTLLIHRFLLCINLPQPPPPHLLLLPSSSSSSSLFAMHKPFLLPSARSHLVSTLFTASALNICEDLHECQKRPVNEHHHLLHLSSHLAESRGPSLVLAKETYTSVKRDLH